MEIAQIEYAAIMISLFFFAASAVFDLKAREVTDKIWIVYGPLGAALTTLQLFINPSTLFLAIVSIAISTLVSLGLCYFGLFGGADAKATICLGLTLPLIPRSFEPFMGYAHPFFPIVVVMGGFICSASAALWLAAMNFLTYLREGPRMFAGLEHEPRWRKLMAIATGYPADVSKLRSIFYLYPMEEVVKNSTGSHRSFKLFTSAETDRNEMVSKFIYSLSELGFQGKVWVTPGLPMLLFMFIGLIVALILGDVVFSTALLLASR